MSSPRLLAIVTEPLEGVEPIAELPRRGNGEGVHLRLVVPAVEDSPFRHILGDEGAGFEPRDLAGIVLGIGGTIAAAILAAATASGGDSVAGAGAAAILIAIGIALVNLAHVVGLTLFQSTHYRGPFARSFARLALIGTPAAVLANLILLIASQ
jgi:hypothetical protein